MRGCPGPPSADIYVMDQETPVGRVVSGPSPYWRHRRLWERDGDPAELAAMLQHVGCCADPPGGAMPR